MKELVKIRLLSWRSDKVKLTGHVECTYGTERISANVLFYFFLSNIIFLVKASCGGIDHGNFLKLLYGKVKLNFVVANDGTWQNHVPKIDLLTRNCNLICFFLWFVLWNSCFGYVSLSKLLVEKIVSVLDMDNSDCTLQGF